MSYAVPLALLGLLGILLSFSQVYRNYQTAIPLATFQTTAAASMLMSAAGLVLFGTVLFALLLCLYPDWTQSLSSGSRALLGRDALLVTAIAIALAGALPALTNWAMSRFPALALPTVYSADSVVSAFPALSAIASAAQRTLTQLVVLSLAIFVWQITAHRRWLTAVIVFAVLCGMLPGDVHTWGEFAFYFIDGLIGGAVILAICLWLARDNRLAYGLSVWAVTLSSAAAGFFVQQNARLTFNGWVVVAVVLASIAWTVAPAFARRKVLVQAG